MSAIERLLDRLDGVRETGPGRWLARCPAHDDGSPSLSVRDVDDRVLIHCFAGCSPGEVLANVDLKLSDLYDRPLAHHVKQTKSRIPPSAALAAIDHEAHVVAIIACDVHANREIAADVYKRLLECSRRIGAARDGCTPARVKL